MKNIFSSRIFLDLNSVLYFISPTFSTIIYTPYFPTRNEVTARHIDHITITLTDQDGKDLDMNTNGGTQDPEAFGVRITISPDELKLSHNQN